MKRRHFLGAAAALVAARWTRLSFADATIAGASSGVLRRALEQARTAGVPLLTLVIPESDDAKYERGRAFGEWIQHGKPALLAPLSATVVACASMSDLRQVAKGLPKGEPWMVVLDASGGIEILDGAVPSGENQTDRRIDALSKIVWSAKTIALPPGRDYGVVGAEVRTKLTNVPPPGSHWATSSMCGFERVEGLKSPDDEKIAMDCGMGHIPERSARFLYFWSRTPEQRYLDRQGRKG